MLAWFKKQSNIIQLVLLILPLVGWIVEVIIRWERVLNGKGKSVLDIVVALVYTLVAWVWVPTIIDAILCVLGKGLLFIDVK